MNFGIDKLKLQTKDFLITNANGFNHRGGKINEPNPYLLTTKEGQEINECGIFTNIPIGKGKANLNIAISQLGLMLEFNPSKHKHPYYLEGIGHLSNVREDIQLALDTLGIDCALEGFKLSRIDVTKQIESERNYIGYKGAMELISSTTSRKRQKEGYITSDTFTRGRMQTQFYDKGVELRDKYHLPIQEKNLIRCETRLMNTPTCQKELGQKTGINYFIDLMNWNNEELNNFHNDILLKELFDKTKCTQLETSINIDKLLTQIQKVGKDKFVKINGYTSIVETIGIDNWLTIQRELNPNITRQGLWNEKKKIEDTYQLGLMMQTNREITKQELVSDLRKAFIDNFKVA